MKITLEILQDIAKFLIENNLISDNYRDRKEAYFYGSCVRKMITEHPWNCERNIIQIAGLAPEKVNKICPRAYCKYTGLELGNWITIGNEKYIIRQRYNYGSNKNKIFGFIGNDIWIKIDDDFFQGTINYSKPVDDILIEEKTCKYSPEYLNQDDFFDLYCDGYFYEENSENLKNKFINTFQGFQNHGFNIEISRLRLFSLLDKINYFEYPAGIKDIFSELRNNKEFIETNKFFDNNYIFSERIVPRIMIQYYYLIKNGTPNADYSFLRTTLRLIKSWRRLFNKFKEILDHHESRLNTSIIAQGRSLVRLSNKFGLSEYEVEEYLIPVIHSIFKQKRDDIDFLIEFYENINLDEIKLPVSGVDLKCIVEDPVKISGILKDLTEIYDRNPELTKEELLKYIK